MLCMSALLFVQAMPVWAAGGTEIALNPGKAQEGSQVQVIQNYKDCVIIGARDKRLAIGKEIADRIKV